VGSAAGLELIRANRPVLFAAWHCHLLAPLYHATRYYAAGPQLVLMASPSRDGEFIAAIARNLGFLVCTGSRRKGGVRALKEMAGYAARGHSCGLAADGSRGPARVVQKGVIYLAREARVPILPVATACRRKITFQTWDRFELPLPLSRLAVLVGEPFPVGPDAKGPALEPTRRELEDRLNRLFRQSQTFFHP
jgi:hypothetical protein